MPNLYEVTISSHFSKDRAERCARINRVLGGDWGEIICAVKEEARHSWRCVTNTGLYVILDENKAYMITCYLATYHRARALYDMAGATMPRELRKQINKNGRIYFELYAENM